MKNLSVLFKICVAFFILFTSFIPNLFATGESCSNAHLVVPSSGYNLQDYFVNNTDNTLWFTFVAIDTRTQVYTKNQTSPGTSARRIDVYTGTCNSFSIVDSISFEENVINLRTINLSGLIVNQVYYVKITGESSNANIGVAYNIFPSSSAPCQINTAFPTTYVSSTNSQNISFYFTSPIIHNQAIFVQDYQTLVIDKNIVFDNCEFIMGNTSAIVINSGFIMEIINSTYIHGCEFIWNGINCNAGTFLMNSNSIIQDANYALSIQGLSEVIIHDALFNKNVTGIYIPGITSSVSVNSSIYNTIFTCRDIPMLPAPSVVTLKSNLTTFTFDNLLSPYSQLIRPIAGIYVRNYPTNAPTFMVGRPDLGPLSNNIFDNLDYGINAEKSNIIIKNNLFNECTRINNGFAMFPFTQTGFGVFAYGKVGVNNYKIDVGGSNTIATNYEANEFFNCGNGIFCDNYSEINILKNKIHSVNNNNFPLYGNGYFGVYLNLKNTAIINIGNNHVSNMLYGIYVVTLSSPVSFLNMTISHNLFDKTNVFNSILGQGIGVETLLSGNDSPRIIIENNSINDSYIGINDDANQSSVIRNNSIKTFTTTALFSHSGIIAQSKPSVEISNNDVEQDPAYYSDGIGVFYCKNPKVYCNTVNNSTRSFIFAGDCSSLLGDVFYNNTMKNAYAGLSLLNGGKIGQQGDATHPSDNIWNKASLFTWHTESDLTSDFTFSPIYTRHNGNNTSNYFPNLNTNSGGNPNFSLIPSISSGKFRSCSSVPVDPGDDDPIDELEELIVGQNVNPNLLEETEWMNKKFVYEKLNFDPEFSTVNSIQLSSFNNTAQFENFAQVADVEELMKQDDFIAAKSLNNLLIPDNQVEDNAKTFNKYYSLLNINPNRKWGASEILELQSLANQCDKSGGEYVIRARILLHGLLGEFPDYSTACNGTSSRFIKLEKPIQSDKVNAKSQTSINSISVSPNPAVNSINVSILGSVNLYKFWIENLSGQIVEERYLSDKRTLVDLSNIGNGAYIYHCRFDSGEIKSGKLIVAH